MSVCMFFSSYFQEFNKLHIELLDCPNLLATMLMSTFPKCGLRRDTLRIMKLSYHKYDDQNKGQLDVSKLGVHIELLLLTQLIFISLTLSVCNLGLSFDSYQFTNTQHLICLKNQIKSHRKIVIHYISSAS